MKKNTPEEANFPVTAPATPPTRLQAAVGRPLMEQVAAVPQDDGRFRTRRERATELQARMAAFGNIYNAAYMVRHSYFGRADKRHAAVMALIAVMLQELRATADHEACLFAVADALYASPLGVPWET